MQRELLRKNAATGKKRPSSKESQPANNEAKRDDMEMDHGLLVTTARRIGSVLGKIVARTEASLSPGGPTNQVAPKKTPRANQSRKSAVKRGSIETGSGNRHLKALSKSQLKRPLRRSPLMKVKRKPRAESLAARNVRSNQE